MAYLSTKFYSVNYYLISQHAIHFNILLYLAFNIKKALDWFQSLVSSQLALPTSWFSFAAAGPRA